MMSPMEAHETHIRSCFELAVSAARRGNHPFGALLVRGGEVVATAENSVLSDRDSTRHAELNLISRLSRQGRADWLESGTVYASTEPCAMCTGAMFWAGVTHIVYGCSAHALGEVTGGAFVVSCRDLLSHGKRNIEVTGPVLEHEGVEIHRAYWSAGPEPGS
jgi:tRNA(Arg) A34 adenosine deaminase TadA